MSDCFTTPRTVAQQAPLSMEFSRQEYWSGLQFPPPGVFPNPGVKPASPMSPASAGGFFTTESHLGSTTPYSAIIRNYAEPKGSLQGTPKTNFHSARFYQTIGHSFKENEY